LTSIASPAGAVGVASVLAGGVVLAGGAVYVDIPPGAAWAAAGADGKPATGAIETTAKALHKATTQAARWASVIHSSFGRLRS
jgi:hypothetical protein